MLRHGLDVALGRAKADPADAPLSAALVYDLLEQTGELDRRARTSPHRPGPVQISANGCRTELVGNGQINVRVNKDCSVRQQAGESIAVNPNEESLRLLAAQNDARLGFNHCGVDWTSNGGPRMG